MLNMSRRGFIGLSVALGAGALSGQSVLTYGQQNYSFSSGSQPPHIKVPDFACDCHHHIYDRNYPYVDDRNLPNASVADYLRLRTRLGLNRSVAIQPSSYGTDNRCLMAALSKLGPTSRGIAVVNDRVTDAELHELQAGGVQGIRFNLGAGSATSPDMIAPLSKRIAELGWHIEVHVRANELMELERILSNLPVHIVFDHFGRLPYPDGIKHRAYRLIADLVERDRAWVKISGAYQDSVLGGPAYDDVKSVARAMIQLAPERIVWGTDWPHPSLQSKKQPMPDDAAMMDLLGVWARDETELHQILVENPARLYKF